MVPRPRAAGPPQTNPDLPSITTKSLTRFARRTFTASLLIIGVAALLVWSVRLLVLFPRSPVALVAVDQPQQADAIILLEGGLARIDRALELVEQGYTDTIVYPGILAWTRGLLEERAQRSDVEFVLVPGSAREGTFDEALKARELLGEIADVDSILLVTSEYHSYRSHWVFRKVLPPSVEIVSTPAAERWWTPDRAAVSGSRQHRTYRSEQIKFLGYYLLYSWRFYP